MTQAAAAGVTEGERLHRGDAVRGGIEAIVGAVESSRRSITEVRGPIDGAPRQTFEELSERARGVRGRPLVYPYLGSGVGNGPLVELVDGSVKYDLITGIGVHFFGHSDPGFVRASLEGAATDVTMQGHLMMNADAVAFTSALVDAASRGSELRHAFLCNSGAMANENALKVCYQKHAPADRVLAFQHCFMGRSTTMAQIGDNASGRQGLPLNTFVDYMPFWDAAVVGRMSAGDVSGSTRFTDMSVMHLEQYLDRYPGRHACFIFELIQGEGGFNTAPRDFFSALMAVCADRGVAVWADEVQTFGRTTEMFAFQALDLGAWVDVACVGKMSQVCAALYTEAYNPKPGLLSGTFLGSTSGLRVGAAMIERLRTGGYYGADGVIARHHERFRAGVADLASRHPSWFPPHPGAPEPAGGVGGMMRFTPFGGDKAAVLAVCKQMFDDGVISFYCGHGPFHVRFLPPLGAMELAAWDDIFPLVERSLSAVASSRGV